MPSQCSWQSRFRAWAFWEWLSHQALGPEMTPVPAGYGLTTLSFLCCCLVRSGPLGRGARARQQPSRGFRGAQTDAVPASSWLLRFSCSSCTYCPALGAPEQLREEGRKTQNSQNSLLCLPVPRSSSAAGQPSAQLSPSLLGQQHEPGAPPLSCALRSPRALQQGGCGSDLKALARAARCQRETSTGQQDRGGSISPSRAPCGHTGSAPRPAEPRPGRAAFLPPFQRRALPQPRGSRAAGPPRSRALRAAGPLRNGARQLPGTAAR